MTKYVAPLRDQRFVLDEIVGLADIAALPGFGHADTKTVAGLLEEYGRFVGEVFAPLNETGDRQGSRLDPSTGAVSTPDGFIEAYRQYVEAGWGAVSFDEEYGGGGFPWLVAIAMQEQLTAANQAFSLCPLLTQGAIEMLSQHGTELQKQRYLPKMVTGEWAGTMNLTESDAGSDVGALRTRAVPAADGSWRLIGTKIFITYGEHDLTENVIHLVLARVPDAPPGTRGLSCFVVPKFLVEADGSLGARNDVRCASIEHKLGIHASPTCVMSYGDEGGAVAELIGEPNTGMRLMFTMMNNARLSVGLEGLAIAERSYQQAHAYAEERRQGHAFQAPAGVISPIIDHADVRRMLFTMRSQIEAMRMMLYTNAAAIDGARRQPDPDARRAAQDLADLLTPVSKAWCTDLGVELTSLAVQIHGGMGYIEETGVAQHYRDARIAPIYEGTNGIQAIDLVGRKVPTRGGAVVEALLARMAASAGDLARTPSLAPLRCEFEAALTTLREATAFLLQRGAADPLDALAGATPYLRLFGTVLGGWLMARQAVAACRGLEADDIPERERQFLEAKVGTARFYISQLLPQAGGLLGAVCAGKDDLFALSGAQLASG